MKKAKWLLLLSLPGYQGLSAQSSSDTAALIKEFTKIMSFTAQPYLYYTTLARMSAEPVLEATDTAVLTGQFYKNNTEIYSSTGREEMYLQDSLMIEINNDSKTIWVRKVDVDTKNNLNLVPSDTKGLIERVQNNFRIRKERVSEDVSRLYFDENKPAYSTSPTTTFIVVEYGTSTLLPRLIEISIEMKQPVNEELAAAIHSEGIDESKLIKTVNGEKQLVRKQKVSIAFTAIGSEREMLDKMPLYKSSFLIDAVSADFTGKGKYKDYEVTKTF